ERLGGRLAGETQEIPARIDERIERVGFARRRGAAFRAIDMFPGRVPDQRVAGRLEIDVFGQRYRKLLLRHWHHAAGAAVDERDRGTPVALPADAPVAQAPYRPARAPAFAFRAVDHRALGFGDAHPVDEVRIDQHAVAGFRFFERRIGRFGRGANHAHDRQAVLGREIEIALVVAGHRHDRASAVFHQHEVRDVDRQVLAGERMPGADAGIEAELLGCLELRGGGSPALAEFYEFRGIAIVARDIFGEWVVGRHGNEAGAENRVGPGGVNLEALAIRQVEPELHALALADPVLLHQPDLLRPVVEGAETGEQVFRKGGDLEEPLVEL